MAKHCRHAHGPSVETKTEEKNISADSGPGHNDAKNQSNPQSEVVKSCLNEKIMPASPG